MTAETSPGREIVPVPAEQLSPEGTAHHPLLERVGFSPRLPERLKRLNDSLSKTDLSELTGLNIDFVSARYPRIYVSPEFRQGVKVNLWSNPKSGTAMLEIVPQNVDLYGTSFNFTDIKNTLTSMFADRKLTVLANPKKTAITLPRFEKDLADVSEEEIRKLTEPLGGVVIDVKFLESQFMRKKSKSGISRRVKDETGTVAQLYELFYVAIGERPSERGPAFTFLVDNPRGDSARCIFLKFYFNGKPEEVEGVIEPLAGLFDKKVLGK